MRLHALLQPILDHPFFPELAEALATQREARLSVADAAKGVTLAALHARLGRPLLVVTSRPAWARRLAEEAAAWSPSPESVLLFPETDALPYEPLRPEPDQAAQRMRALQALAACRRGAPGLSGTAPLVIASVRAWSDRLLSPGQYQGAFQLVTRGQRMSPFKLISSWLEAGYEPAHLVEAPGQFARRGGVVDIYPPVGEGPYRLEFLGDEIESIRCFDPVSQRSTHLQESASISPAFEVLGLPPGGLDATLQKAPHQTAQHVLRGSLAPSSLLDYLPDSGVLVLDEPDQAARRWQELEAQFESLKAELQARGEIPRQLDRPYWPWEELHGQARARPLRRVLLSHDPDRESIPFVRPPGYAGRLPHLVQDLRARLQGQERVALISLQTARLSEVFEEHGLAARVTTEVETDAPGLTLVHGALQEGWRCEPLGLTLLTDTELFGFAKLPSARGARAGQRSSQLPVSDLAEGDYVVHVDHGIAQYRGLVRLAVPDERSPVPGQVEHEYLLLGYAQGDRLYVPVDQSDRVARYLGGGSASAGPSLTRLGGGEWAKAKARVRRAVRSIAGELLELYAAREVAEGHAFSPDTPWQAELEASFPYAETPDQLQALDELRADMEAARPMDRLLVGDVGYGKTELALRAAFKAVAEGMQVAMLVPTTVLAQQHFATIRHRLAPFPVSVEMLSRFRSEREQQSIVEGLQQGRIDICIGTHRLLQRDVAFKNLGLVIVDEEQRFGVRQKELLKQLRREVDVLTLTATPIPRTLQLALTGVRDMSTIETAPEGRMPVRTYVAQADDGLVREAILRELDRGGQVYFVHNRVRGIELVARRLALLVPEARLAVAHGQMPEEQLERVMLEFSQGEHDMLLCTTIIESGLDMPNVNTLIVNDAHRFGLGQLYQLRGRVGRGSARAFAYFLCPRDASLSPVAEERLRTIFEATELGAGFRIAMKDLEIRGAGDLLGPEQSGHIVAVGFDLYTRLLADAVEAARMARDGKTAPRQETRADGARLPSVDLPLSALLPPEYVAQEALRLDLYTRLASASSTDQLSELSGELRDRFGDPPEAVQNLLYLLRLRLSAAEAGVKRISTSDGVLVVLLHRPSSLDATRLAARAGVPVWVGSNQVRMRMAAEPRWMSSLPRLVEALKAPA